MSFIVNFYRSAIGKKAVMAVTGLILFGWIFLHMVGNLKLYLGPEHMNEYAHWLRALGTPAMPETTALWVSRLVLLVCAVLHIHSAYSLTMMNRAARPVGYRDREYIAGTYAFDPADGFILKIAGIDHGALLFVVLTTIAPIAQLRKRHIRRAPLLPG